MVSIKSQYKHERSIEKAENLKDITEASGFMLSIYTQAYSCKMELAKFVDEAFKNASAKNTDTSKSN